MKKIVLTKGKYALVDNSDFEWLNQWKWYFNNIDYAVRGDEVRMHRLIMKAPKGLEVDHINGNGLDNRRKNLRLVTHQQNLFNQKLSNANTSGFKGVYWFKPAKKWRAFIKLNQKQIHLGYFIDPSEAAYVYDEAAKFWFGPWARTNF